MVVQAVHHGRLPCCVALLLRCSALPLSRGANALEYSRGCALVAVEEGVGSMIVKVVGRLRLLPCMVCGLLLRASSFLIA